MWSHFFLLRMMDLSEKQTNKQTNLLAEELGNILDKCIHWIDNNSYIYSQNHLVNFDKFLAITYLLLGQIWTNDEVCRFLNHGASMFEIMIMLDIVFFGLTFFAELTPNIKYSKFIIPNMISSHSIFRISGYPMTTTKLFSQSWKITLHRKQDIPHLKPTHFAT